MFICHTSNYRRLKDHFKYCADQRILIMAVLVRKLANGTSYVVFVVCFFLALQYSRSLGEKDFYLIPRASQFKINIWASSVSENKPFVNKLAGELTADSISNASRNWIRTRFVLKTRINVRVKNFHFNALVSPCKFKKLSAARRVILWTA